MESRKPLVLIVDDSLTQREVLKHILAEKKFAVAEAENGIAALEYLASNIPDIVISDILMPVMDGYTLCSRIKADVKLKNIPVLLLTTLSSHGDILKGLECGADNFVTKPYDSDHLVFRIRDMLNNRDLNSENSFEAGIELDFGGRKQLVTSSRRQILDMLMSAYETAVKKNIELEKANMELREANEKIRTLSGLIPICSVCKKIRNDNGYWEGLEQYIAEHSDAMFSHGYCPECGKVMMQKIDSRKKAGKDNS